MIRWGPLPAQTVPLPVAGRVAEPDGGDEADPLDEHARAVPHDDDHLTARGGDLGRAPCAGQAHLGVVVRRRSRWC